MRLFKKTNLAAVVIVALVVIFGLAKMTRAESAHWRSSLEEASGEAQESNKPMMIDFWAGWCEACTVMDNNVYTNDSFVNEVPQFLAVRIDFDKKQAIARKYNVTTLPTIIFTDSYGAELFRYSGYIGAKALVELMHSLPTDVSEFNKQTRILARDKNNSEALATMGKDLRNAGLYLTSNDYYQRALDRKEVRGNVAERQSIMTQTGLNYLDVEDGKKAAETFELCLKEFPDGANKQDWVFGLARAYVLSGKSDKSRALLKEFISKHPGDPSSEAAKTLLNSLEAGLDTRALGRRD